MDCPFCKISKGELSAAIVYKDGLVIAVMSNAPLRPGHMIINRNCPGRPLGFAIDRSRADVSQGGDDIARGHLQAGQRRFGLGAI